MYFHINYNCFNELFAVSTCKILDVDMHGFNLRSERMTAGRINQITESTRLTYLFNRLQFQIIAADFPDRSPSSARVWFGLVLVTFTASSDPLREPHTRQSSNLKALRPQHSSLYFQPYQTDKHTPPSVNLTIATPLDITISYTQRRLNSLFKRRF